MDHAVGTYRSAVIEGDRVEGIMCLGKAPNARPGKWLSGMLLSSNLTATERRALLAGEMPDGTLDSSPIVCVCNQVSTARIADVIARGCQSSEAVGKACQAGTNCGSCLPEINRMLSNAGSADNRARIVLEPAQ